MAPSKVQPFHIRRRCKGCGNISPMRPKTAMRPAGMFCGHPCAMRWKWKTRRAVMLAAVREKGQPARFRTYVNRVRRELDALVPPGETFTREEALAFCARSRARGYQAGWKLAYQKYGRLLPGRPLEPRVALALEQPVGAAMRS